MRAVAILAVCALTPLTDTVAQERLTLVAGQRLRLTAPPQGAYDQEMRYVGAQGDTMILTADTAVAFPFSDLVRLEILRGQRSYQWPGAIIGLVLGTAIGWRIGKAIDESCEPGPTRWCIDVAQRPGAIVGAVIGLAAGAVLGNRIKTDKWEEVPLDRVQMSIAPTRNGFGIGARIAF
jgi:hypothetical protein